METVPLSIALIISSAIGLLVVGAILQYFFHSRRVQSHNKALQQQLVTTEQSTALLEQQLTHSEQIIEKHQSQQTQLEKRYSDEQQNKQQISEQLVALKTRLEEKRKAANEKVEQLKQVREQMATEFRDLAAQVMEKNSERFSKHHKDSLGTMLDPFKQQLQDFRKRVDHVYDTESQGRVALLAEITSLKSLNQQITEEAANLTKALKGDRKAQGNWGEVILQKVLEASGLHEGREYETQVNLQSNEGNRYLPDVVLHLPDKKDIIVDAKVSLSAYERFFSSETEEEKQLALKQHIQAIRSHVDKLSEKKYDDLKGVHTLDFVFIFIPIEPAYLLAAQEDANLFSDAFGKKIIIVSPTTLLATLRIVENLWRFERQNKNAEEIARSAGRLYDKFVGFVDDLNGVGKRLEQAHDEFEAAKSKLSTGKGNLLTSTEKLKKLGAKARKQLDKNLLEEDDENKTLEMQEVDTDES